MAIDTDELRRTDPEEIQVEALAREEPSSPSARATTTSAGHAAVVLVVCLGLWALLLAPTLERDAETAPIGLRRAVALAVLRPLSAVAEGLAVDRAAESVERALGRDPSEPPGGLLDLPPVELPPIEPSPSASPSSPAGGSRGNGRSEDPARPAPSPSPTEPAVPDTSIRTPTPGDKLRVAIVGDSLAQGLGPAIVELFDPDVARALSLGRQSTGLARADYFNWTAAMRQLAVEFRPDLVFVLIGSNDNQAQIGPDGQGIAVGSTAWVEVYRARAARFLREATSTGTRVVWVGIPVVQDRQRWGFYRRVNAIYRDTAAADPLATYVDAWALLQPKEGGYAAFLRNERGVLQEMRAGDGIHFTPTGYGYLARVAIRAAADAFELPARAVTFRI